MRKVKILIYSILVLASCSSRLRSGDLVFQVNPSNGFVDAITDVTSSGTGLAFSHVGIIYIARGEKPSVIEATPEDGVRLKPLDEFLSESAEGPDGKPLVVFRRPRVPKAVAKAACKRALSHLGKEYDSFFEPGTERLYCSELVQDAFGEDLFPSIPMTFKDSTGNISPLWTDWFARHEKNVPEGAPGTNPNDMFKAECLRPL